MTDEPSEIDVEVGRYALRTFRIDVARRTLLPVSAAGMDDGAVWSGGNCLARCNHGRAHIPPADDCSCGIYGATTLASLLSQYPTLAVNIVAVIAAEGSTVIGAEGLRTRAARVVAYWCSPSPQLNCARDIFAEHCASAAAFEDCQAMLDRYDLSRTVIAGASRRQWSPLRAIAAAMLLGCMLIALAACLSGEPLSAYHRLASSVHLALSALLTAHLAVPLALMVSCEIGFWRAALKMRSLARHQANYVATRSAEVVAMLRLSAPTMLRTVTAALLAGSVMLALYAVGAHMAGSAETAAAAVAAAIVYVLGRSTDREATASTTPA